MRKAVDRVILHIGKHKTGSSSIQASLSGLDQDGVRYAELPIANHSNAMKAVFAPLKAEKWNERNNHRTAEQLARYRSRAEASIERALGKPARTLIFSAEAMEFFEQSEVRSLIDFMQARADRVEVIAFVRSPRSGQISGFQEQVKYGIRRAILNPVRYRKAFKHYLDMLGTDAVRILPFNHAGFVEGSLLRTFLHGIDEPQVKCEERRSNEGMAAAATRLLFLHNRNPRFPTAGQRNTKARNLLWRKLRDEVTGPKLTLPDECHFSPGLDREVEWLRSVSGIDFSADLGRVTSDRKAASKALLAAMADIDATAIERLHEVVARETGQEPHEKPRPAMAQLYRFYGGRAKIQ